jgi:hypothetical protein
MLGDVPKLPDELVYESNDQEPLFDLEYI